jgi:hypothetical protein
MMEGSEKYPGGAGGEEEELIDLDFDFEELMEEPLDETLAEVSPEQEEIIELVDVVETGDVPEEGEGTAELTGVASDGDTGEMPMSLEEEVRAGLDNMMEGFDTSEVDLGSMGQSGQQREASVRQGAASQVAESSDEDIDRDLELELEAALEGFDTSQIDVAEQGIAAEGGIPEEIAGLFEEGSTRSADGLKDEAFDTDAIDLDELPELELPDVVESQLEEMAAEEEPTSLGAVGEELDHALTQDSSELQEVVEAGLPEEEIALEELESDREKETIEFGASPGEDFGEAGREEVSFEDFGPALGEEATEFEEAPAGPPSEAGAEMEEVAFEDLGTALGEEAIAFGESPSEGPMDQEADLEAGAFLETAERPDEWEVPTDERWVEEEPPEPGAGLMAPAESAPPGISEERLEAMITKVVEEVVERVARETMVSVAERLITGAIEALRASQESTSE